MWLPSLPAVVQSWQTSGTTITAHADVHTKGSWVELTASAPFDVTFIGIKGSDTRASGTDTSQLTDIGIGAAASEVVLIDNIPTGYSVLNKSVVWFPVDIPSGTRLAARMQAKITVDVVDIQLLMFGKSSWSSTPQFQSIDTLGALTASSHGTVLSTTIAEIIGSTAHDYTALGWGVDGGGDTSLGAAPTVEILVGAAAAEKTLIGGLQVNTGAAESIDQMIFPLGILPMEMNIPAGSRLSAKFDTGSSSIGLVLYGFR